jgi:spore coat protein A, manganese oxidase
MLTRRSVLKLSAAVGGGLALPAAYAANAATTSTAPTAAANPVLGPLFAVPMPVLPVLRPAPSAPDADFYQVTMRETDVELVPGTRTRVLTYNGAFPGPVIMAKVGRPITVRQINGLAHPTSVHLHGGHVPPTSDGHPMDAIAPGKSKTYFYPNAQPAATLWYHDHIHHMEAEHVYRGLAAPYLLRDSYEADLPLPKGQYDVTIMLRDADLRDDGSLVFTMDDFFNRNTILVNGRPWPFFQVAARKYRLRFINSSNMRVFELRLATGDPMTQIAGDQGLLSAPVEAPTVRLSPGERAEVVVDFAKYEVGTQIVLQNTFGFTPETAQVMRFDVAGKAEDPSSVPAAFRPLPKPPIASVSRDFKLHHDLSTMRSLINDQSFDPDRVDTTIKFGATEIWTVSNLDTPEHSGTPFGIPHSFHLHLARFRVLDRDGRPPAGGEAGLKDTVEIPPGSTVRLLATFNGFRGRYVYHCHLIDHSSMGMMATMEIR